MKDKSIDVNYRRQLTTKFENVLIGVGKRAQAKKTLSLIDQLRKEAKQMPITYKVY